MGLRGFADEFIDPVRRTEDPDRVSGQEPVLELGIEVGGAVRLHDSREIRFEFHMGQTVDSRVDDFTLHTIRTVENTRETVLCQQ